MILLALMLALAAAAIGETLRALRTDGYGRHASPPRSHPEEHGIRTRP